MTNRDAPEPQALDFADVIEDLGHGSVNKQASRLLAEIVNACQEHGGKGKLTLIVSVECSRGLAEIAATAKATIPQPKLPGGTYFQTKTGGLVTEDPRQVTMGAKVLDIPRTRGGGDVS